VIPRSVVISPDAADDIMSIYKQIAQAAGAAVANAYIDRLEAFLAGFDIGSERGTLRTDLRPNLRIVGFERSITIAFKVKPDHVEILRCFRGGQNWENKI
jgi:toxin ParE1/3/4